MWSKISSALKTRDGTDNDSDCSDTQSPVIPRPAPDPFCANAATYYTHITPNTPPHGAHSRTASREEDIIWSLRTQLALQQEMCAQYEIDLRARDELVEALTLRLDAAEKENEKRKSVTRSWKKKCAELEKMCRRLEEEVDSNRQETLERSIMDEASGEALRQLHRQIQHLEREKSEVQSERDVMTREKEKLAEDLAAANETSHHQNDRITELEEEASRLRAQVQQMQKDSAAREVAVVQLNKQLAQDKEDIDGLNIALESKQQELELVKRKHRSAPVPLKPPRRTTLLAA